MALSKVSTLVPQVDAPAGTPVTEKPIDYAHCDKHGSWAQSFRNEVGEIRSLPQCPRCARDAQSKQILDRAAIPHRFQDRTFDNYAVKNERQRTALNISKAYAEKFSEAHQDGRCLTMTGKPGTGKTHLACAIAQYAMGLGYSAMFLNVYDLIDTVRATWDRNSSKSETDVLRAFQQVDLLVLDEVGVQRGTDDERNIIFKVINGRYSNGRPMIILSNLPAYSDDPKDATLTTYLGERAFDRLREGSSRLVVFDWESYRKKP
jgi:DNA replication protein DnaC